MDGVHRRQSAPEVRRGGSPSSTLVLVIDDDPLVRARMTDGLARLGYEVIAPATEAECVDALEMPAPRVIVIDHWLFPETLTGADIVRILRLPGSGHEEVPIIGISSGKSSVELVDAGVDYFLEKPFSAMRCAEVIETLIDRVKDRSLASH